MSWADDTERHEWQSVNGGHFADKCGVEGCEVCDQREPEPPEPIAEPRRSDLKDAFTAGWEAARQTEYTIGPHPDCDQAFDDYLGFLALLEADRRKQSQ